MNQLTMSDICENVRSEMRKNKESAEAAAERFHLVYNIFRDFIQFRLGYVPDSILEHFGLKKEMSDFKIIYVENY